MRRLRGWVERNPLYSAAVLALLGTGVGAASLGRDFFDLTIDRLHRAPTVAQPSGPGPTPNGVAGQPGPTPSAASPSTGAPSTGSPGTGSLGTADGGSEVAGESPVAAAPAPRLIEVTLPRHAAVDLDRPGQRVVPGQSGITGGFDLFHDAGRVMSDVIRAANGVYIYPAGKRPDDAYDVCADYTGPNPSYNAYNLVASVQTGVAFCFKTSGGLMAFATVNAVQPTSWVTTLAVRVWDR